MYMKYRTTIEYFTAKVLSCRFDTTMHWVTQIEDYTPSERDYKPTYHFANFAPCLFPGPLVGFTVDRHFARELWCLCSVSQISLRAHRGQLQK